MVGLLCGSLMTRARADTLQLVDGTVVTGEPVTFNGTGLVMKTTAGKFEPIPWGKVSQASLKELVKNPKARRFAEPFIEAIIEIEEKDKPKPPEIVLKPVPRLQRPEGKPSLLAVFASPLGLALVAVLYAANFFAAHEVASFRHQPVALVCGLAAVVPWVVPAVFLCLPTRTPPEEESAAPVEEGAPADQSAPPPPGLPPDGETEAAAGRSLRLAAREMGEGAIAETKVFTRGEYTFNRRFFETKAAGFFRVVPGEAEKDLVLLVKATRGEYVARRISRITGNEMHIQLQKGDASAEIILPFVEINEVQIKHKDTK